MSDRSRNHMIYAAVAANVGIALSKFIAAWLTRSSGLLSEGIHSLVDTSNGVLLYLGARLSQRPADPLHPFGHGKEVYFWSLIVAMVIFAGGGGMSLYEGIEHLANPTGAKSFAVGYAVLGASALFEGISFSFAYREFKKYREGKLRRRQSVGQVLRTARDPGAIMILCEDGAALVGLSIAAVGLLLRQLTGSPIPDSVASILIGLLLASVAVFLAAQSRGLLLGERALKPVIDDIRAIASREEGVREVRQVLTMHLGPQEVLLTLRVELKEGLSAAALKGALTHLCQAIKEAHQQIKYVFVDVDGLFPDEPAPA